MARNASRIASAIAGVFILNTVFAAASTGETVNTGSLTLPPDLVSLPCWPDNVEGLKVHAVDAAGQKSESNLVKMSLPKRVFKNPLAQVLEEQRCLLSQDTGKKEEVTKTISSLFSGSHDSAMSAPAWFALQSLHRTLTDAKTDEDLYKFIALSWDVMLLLEEPPVPENERPLRGAWNERAAMPEATQTSGDSLKKMEEFLAQQEKLLSQTPAGQMSEKDHQETAKMLKEQRAMLDALKKMNTDLEKANPDLSRKAVQRTLDQMQEQMRQQMQKSEGKKENGKENDKEHGEQKESPQEGGKSADSSNLSQKNGMQGQMQQMRDAQKMQKQYEEIQNILAEQQKLLDETTGQKNPMPSQEQVKTSLQKMKENIAKERQKQEEKKTTAQQMRAQAEKQRAEKPAQDSPAAPLPQNKLKENPKTLEMEAKKLEQEAQKNIEKLDKMDSAIEDMQKQDRMSEEQKKDMLEKLENMVQSLQQMNKENSQKNKDKKQDDSQSQDEEKPDAPLTTQELEKLLDKIKTVVEDLATFFTEQQKTLEGMSEENIKNIGKTADWAATTEKREDLRTIINTLRTLIDMDPMSGTVELRDKLDQLEEMLEEQDPKKETTSRINESPILLASADPAIDRLILAQAMTAPSGSSSDMKEIKKELGGIANALQEKNQERIKRARTGQELVDHMNNYIKDLDTQLENARKEGQEPDRQTLESMTNEAKKIIEVLQKLSEQQKMENQTGKDKDQQGSSAQNPDIQMQQEAEEQINQLMRQLEHMQQPQSDGPDMQMKMDKKNQVPTKLDEQQQNLRNRLNQLQEQMDQGMLPLDEAGDAMDESSQHLKQNNREEAASRQKQAIQSLEQAAGELKARLQKSLQGMSMPGGKSGKSSGGAKEREQSDIEQGLADPLGRPSTHTPAGKGGIPHDGPDGKAREITEKIREKLSNPEIDKKERDYLRRLIKRYEP